MALDSGLDAGCDSGNLLTLGDLLLEARLREDFCMTDLQDPGGSRKPSGRSLFVDPETGSVKRSALFLLCLAVAGLLTWWLGSDPELTPAATRGLFILLLAVLLWVTEVVPAFSVGILVIGLQIALLGDPEDGVFAKSDKDWQQFVAVLGHPLIWLFFGGFVLAAGMARCGLDRWMADKLLVRFGDRYGSVLLGVMLVTFGLSMLMSNTATTAMMLAILAPLLATLDDDDGLAKGLLLGTAIAANLGGMGSLIGSPPNAIAVGALAELAPAQDISFLQWLILGLPPALVSMLIAWQVLLRLYPSQRRVSLASTPSEGDAVPAAAATWQRSVVAGGILLTVGLWLTSAWHGVPTAAVSFVPIVLFTTTGILGTREVRTLNYDVLFLMAGGLTLGAMVTKTGLADWIVSNLPLAGTPPVALGFLFAYATALLSNFMSNTAAANIMIPLGITMAVGFESGIAVAIAFGASAAMCLPVATPPNAMIYATGRCAAGDFLRMGIILGILVPAIGIGWLILSLAWIA